MQLLGAHLITGQDSGLQKCNTESSQPHPSRPTGPGEAIHAKKQSWHKKGRGKWARTSTRW